MSSIFLCFSCATVIFSFVFVDCGLFTVQPTTFQSDPDLRTGEILAEKDQNYTRALYFGDLLRLNDTHNGFLSKNINMSSNSVLSSVFNNDQVDLVRTSTSVSKNLSEFALEGGGIVLTQNSSEANKDGPIALDDDLRGKKSKGRKGVKFPGSSVVPRKGAPVTNDHIELQSNSTPESESQSVIKNVTKPLQPMKSNLVTAIKNETITQLVSGEVQGKLTSVSNSSHSKKPEYVSDEKDFLDFDKYTIIKTSTTGEDYVIIGIVIVIGIWFSVFGALIFYRRAGEYWDRRHYRRMDFLVEGMYNE